MSSGIDLGEYFRRIAYEGEALPTLETLKSIHALHPQVIAFENLDPFTGLTVELDFDSIWQKLVRNNRGGYCFEQNMLLMRVLKEIGFKVKGLSSRIRWKIPPDVQTARGHMLLLVMVEGESYIADVGFGGLTLTAPLLLTPDIEQHTPHEPFRLMQVEHEYELQALVRKEWRSVYRFSLQEQFLPDYEVASWYLCNYPASHFRTGLIAARTAPATRYALRDNELAVHRLNQPTERHVISELPTLRNVLENTFGLSLDGIPNIEDRLLQLINKAAVPENDQFDQ